MNTLSYKTISANKQTVTKQWWVVDAEGQTVGRLCSEIAKIVRGKHKPSSTPHVDCGDHVVVINAEKVVFTGDKLSDKTYVRYTGYPGGQRFISPKTLMKRFPERIVEKAVRGMLPKNRLGAQLFHNLHVYAGNQHPHQAQEPKSISFN